MKLTVTKAALLDALQTVQNVVGVRTTLPILLNVLVSADKNQVQLTTTDLDLTVRCAFDAQVSKPGATTMPVRRLFSIIRELPEGDIEVTVDEKDVATVSSGSSVFKIIGLREDEFPPAPKADGKYTYRLEQAVLKEMLKKTSYAASSDETRFVLNGCLMSFKENKLTVVATDGRRLALVEQEVEVPKEAETDLILPTKTVNELLRILKDDGEVKITRKENQIVFEFATVMVASKLVEGTYPNYRQVIPGRCEERVTIERETFLSALRRVALLTTDKSNATKLTFGKNKLVILMTTPDIGEARETLPIKYTGKEISVAFNPEFMMDPLRVLPNDEVFIELTDDLSPGVIKCDIPFLYVIMPMRVS